MTDTEMKFLLNQWGNAFTSDVIRDIAGNITKTPNDSIVLAVAVKYLNKRIDDVITTIKTLQKSQTTSGFDAVVTSPPAADPIAAPAAVPAASAT